MRDTVRAVVAAFFAILIGLTFLPILIGRVSATMSLPGLSEDTSWMVGALPLFFIIIVAVAAFNGIGGREDK